MDDSRRQQANAASRVPEQDISAELKLSPEQIAASGLRKRALSAWQHLNVDVEPFVARVLETLESTLDEQSTVDSLAIEDLFLCYACSTGNDLALEAFSREYESELRIAASRLNAGSYDDVRQVVWNRLFLSNQGHPPSILDYRGTGPLRHWFRVLATRAILDESRKQKRADVKNENVKQRLLAEAAAQSDPELDHIRERYRDDFRSAFEQAIGLLSPEERNLLRCTYLSGMSTGDIGRAFGIHKATAARQLLRARQRLLDLTRTALKGQLGANSAELDSVIRLFDGELSISLSRLLR